MSSILLLCRNWHIYSTCLFILQFKTIPYPWVWILWILQGIGWIREYHCIPIIRPETILLIYLCAPMWLRYKVFFIPTNVSGFLDSSVLSFDHQPLDWGGKKSISAQRGGETQPVIEFMDVLCERWGFHNCMKHLNNIRGAEGLRLCKWSVEPRSAEGQWEEQLHVAASIKSDCSFCER